MENLSFPLGRGSVFRLAFRTDRRSQMKLRTLPFGLSLLTVAPALAATASPAQAVDKKPNILYIVSDDLGWKDVGFHGATDIKTPNLDRLAADGVRLEQFYVQPMCTPTRAALMTGRYPLRYGLQTLVIPSKGTYGLATDERLLPEALKDAGYKTAMVGKWHLGHADRKYWPRQRGFDYHYGAVLGEIDYFTHDSHGVLDWQRDNKPVKEEGYVTQLLGQDAPAGLVLGQGRTALPVQRQGTHRLAIRFLSPRVQLQLPQGVAQRRLEIAVLLVIVRQVAEGIQGLLVQALALNQRPLLKLGAIFEKEAVQELCAIELDHFFQPCRPERWILDAPAPVLFARLKDRVELGEVQS